MFAFLRSAGKSVTRRAALFSTLALAACAPVAGVRVASAPAGPAVDTSGPVRVAMLLPYGSGQATDDLVARNLENAARLAVSDLSGVQIDLKVYNTAGNPSIAAAAATRAADEGAKIILGPLYAEAANAAGLAVASRGINVLAFSNNTDIAGGNVFVLGQTFQNSADRLVSYAASRGKGRVLVVHSNDTAGDLGRRAIESAIGRTPARLVGTVGYDFSQEGIVAAVPRAVAAAKSGSADSVFLTANVNADLPVLAQLLPERGLTAAQFQYLGLTRWDRRPELFNSPALQGAWFTLPDEQIYPQFQQRFAARYGQQPHILAGLGYDGIAAIGALLKNGRRDALSARSLVQGAGFSGVNGAFRFRGDGTNQRALAVATIRNKSVVVIDPAPKGFTGPGY